ncbi:MAG: CPBP family intramembrane metalloprotease domain-containing protein [Chloroflexi bacterium]|nr:CPBP family intramembrane metalloprotease domain-containing protein [Chloroflexota bacterium]MDL1944294.1 CPBP family intramembrane metalloprotease [Chloroflexi bacterium CFX2]
MNNMKHILRLPASQLGLAFILSFAMVAIMAIMDYSMEPRPSLILSRTIGVLLAAGAILLLGRTFQRKTLEEIGISLRGAAPLILQGALIGIFMTGMIVGVMMLMGWYQILDVDVDALAIGRTLTAFFLVALFEELLFRGVLFWQLDNMFGSWLALLITSAFFGITHLGNANATLWTALAVAIGGGLSLGAAYLMTRNVWVAVGLHWMWNFLQGPIFGFSVSGNATYKALTAAIHGPALWTGGAFGADAGLPALIAATLASAAMLWIAARRKHFSSPSWSRR